MPTPTRKHIGKLIEALRLKREMTRPELGERCNVSQMTIHRWERSQLVLPKYFKGLSLALRVSVKRLEAENRDKRKYRPGSKRRTSPSKE